MSAILQKSYLGQAERYFDRELSNGRDNYYSEDGTIGGKWEGKGAAGLGLSGAINREDFSKLSRGINPETNERIRRRTFSRTRTENGELRAVKERAGWDLVISAPKSVSIVGLIGDDERVRDAHYQSVSAALERAELQAQSNNGGGKKEQTNNLVIARFEHDSSRPGKDGYVAPQLHTHAFIFNATQRADGKWKPLESLELHKSQNYLKSVYYAELADNLQKLGYGIEIDQKTGAPEIRGISKDFREANSPRRAEILEKAALAGRNFRQLGLVDRREKIFDKTVIREQHQQMDAAFDYQAAKLVERVREKQQSKDLSQATGASDINQQNSEKAREAVGFALEKLSERESVFAERDVLHEANKRGLGETSVSQIERELESRKSKGEVKTVNLRDGKTAAYLSGDEKLEKDLAPRIQNKGSQKSLDDELANRVDQTLKFESPEALKERMTAGLSDEQRQAVDFIARTKAPFATLEGRAGVGKTTTLKAVKDLARSVGFEVYGLAPTTGAAHELNEAGVKAGTLQQILANPRSVSGGKRYWIVDESSFVSTRQMDKFVRQVVGVNDKVLFVGDTRQHEGVEAGRPFARMQRENLTEGARIEQIRRQTNESDRETVRKLSEGQITQAVKEMGARGQIREIGSETERHRAIVQNFLSVPERSLVIAPRNSDREIINGQIHRSLQGAGRIGAEETRLQILRPRNELTGAERKFAGAYREGDVIRYTRGSREHGISARSQAKVTGTDRQNNLLTIETDDGRGKRFVTYNPKRLSGVSVWSEEAIKISTGERLQLRAPLDQKGGGRGDKSGKVANGTLLTVKKITGDKLTLQTAEGQTINLETKQAVPLDYGYAVTSHSSQGKTVDRVLIHADTKESRMLLNERMAYVAVSRARHEALIFTDDAQKLGAKLERRNDKREILTAVRNQTFGNQIDNQIGYQFNNHRGIGNQRGNGMEKEFLQQMKTSIRRQKLGVERGIWKNIVKSVKNDFRHQPANPRQIEFVRNLQKTNSELGKAKAQQPEQMNRLEAGSTIMNSASTEEKDRMAKALVEHFAGRERERQATSRDGQTRSDQMRNDHERYLSR